MLRRLTQSKNGHNHRILFNIYHGTVHTIFGSTRPSRNLNRLFSKPQDLDNRQQKGLRMEQLGALGNGRCLQKKKIVMHCYKFIMYGGTSRFCLAINCCHVKYHGAKHYAPDFCKDGMGMIKRNDIALAFILHQYCIFLSHNTPQTLTLGHVSRRDPLKNRRWISRSLRKIKSNLFKHCLSSPFMNKN